MVVIRKAKKSDIKDIVHVCYKTGYMGEDCTGHFSDEKLFGFLFSQYYPEYERDHSFVAEHDGKVVGYILGSPDTRIQGKRYIAKMVPKIILRMLFYTTLRYNKDFRMFLREAVIGLKYLRLPKNTNNVPHEKINEIYPAHLHIDILVKYQRQGIGERLMKTFLKHMKKLGVMGIHLGTSEKNTKAVPFYRKMGFKIVRIDRGNLWPDEPDVRSITFAKKL